MASFFLLFRSKEMEEQKHETCLAQLFGPLAAFFWRLLTNLFFLPFRFKKIFAFLWEIAQSQTDTRRRLFRKKNVLVFFTNSIALRVEHTK